MDKNEVKLPRGIRNNNPLNIMYSRRNNWLGQLGYNPVIEDRFCRFEHMRWGFRAAFVLIKRYMRAQSLDTPRRIIAKWAPSCENDTKAYLWNVCLYSGLSADQKLSFDDQVDMLLLVSAMCRVENGNKYNPQQNSQLWKAMYDGYIDARG